MPAVPIKEASVDQAKEVGHRERRVRPEQLDLQDAALLGLDEDVRPGDRISRHQKLGGQLAVVLERAAGAERVGRSPPCRRLGPVGFGPLPQQVVRRTGRGRQELSIDAGRSPTLSNGDDGPERRKRGVRKRVAQRTAVHPG
jgi:hypothetical protein